nr:5-formyltetrahydrofolate cyclo-ligase [Thioalkalivibrio sp.]
MSQTIPALPTEEPLVLRLRFRRQRAALDDGIIAEHSAAISDHARRCLRLLRPRTLAGYFGIRGEIDILPLLEQQSARGIRIAMPILESHRSGRMHFRSWHPDAPLCHNAFGIPEPCHDAPRVWRRELDIVLLPLVAFDSAGYRLGMGGGYYDRYFARRRFGFHRPRLIGIAHGFQQVPRLERQPWDVPLDGVITEAGWTGFQRLPGERAD